MCAEEVKAAALVCRFCGHKFGQAEEALPIPPRPAGVAPGSVTQHLRPGEELLVWSPGYLHAGRGIVVVTTDRVFFVSPPYTEVHFENSINADRHVALDSSPTKPRSCRRDGSVIIRFSDGGYHFHGLNPEVARELAATVVPDMIDRLFDGEPDMQQRLRDRQDLITRRQSALAPKISLTLWGCTYLGGFSGLSAPRVRVALAFSPDAITISDQAIVKKAATKTLYTVSKPRRGGVAIERAAQMQQRLTATRMATMGVFSLAAPKRTAVSYIALSVSIGSGETGIIEVKGTDQMSLQARLSPWLAEH